MIPPMVLDPLPIVPKIYSSPKRKHLISYHLITSYTTISYHIISSYIISSYIISYHLTSYQESIYSSPTRRHLPLPYSLLQQEDIFHDHIVFSNNKTCSSPTRRHTMSPDHTYRLQTHHLGSIHII